MYAQLGDVRLFFDIDGAGLVPDGATMRERPVLLLAHGGPGGDHSGYKPVLHALTDRAQLVYFDHRGSGRSQRCDPATYTLATNVADMEALRQYLGVERIVACGASYGGVVAQAYALTYPQHVAALIVLASVSDAGFLPLAQHNLAERGTPAQHEQGALLWAGAFPDDAAVAHFFEVMAPLYSLRYDPARANEKRGRAIYSAAAINKGFTEVLPNLNLTPRLPDITVPALVIGGRHDWICPPVYAELIAQQLPHADLRIFEQSGHSLLQDEPAALLDVLRGFLVYRGI